MHRQGRESDDEATIGQEGGERTNDAEGTRRSNADHCHHWTPDPSAGLILQSGPGYHDPLGIQRRVHHVGWLSLPNTGGPEQQSESAKGLKVAGGGITYFDFLHAVTVARSRGYHNLT